MRRTRASRQLTGTVLKARCRSLREQLLGQQIASAEEVDDVWPGGPSNAGAGLDGWIECYAQLTRLAGRLERSQVSGTTDHALLEATVRAAAARQPVAVTLSIGERMVYPKSAYALSWLDALDAIAQPAARLATELAQQAETAPDDLRGVAALTQSEAFRTWAWILLSEGVGLPFPDEGVISPPEYTEQLLPEDFFAIYVAHRKIHFEAIALMAASMPSDGEGGERSRLSLSGFLAGYASEHGIAPSHIMRRWAFPEALAAALAAAEAHRVAQANAKAKRSEGAR